MKACTVKMITMLSAKCVSSQTGMRLKKGLQRVWCFSVLEFNEFQCFSVQQFSCFSTESLG